MRYTRTRLKRESSDEKRETRNKKRQPNTLSIHTFALSYAYYFITFYFISSSLNERTEYGINVLRI